MVVVVGRMRIFPWWHETHTLNCHPPVLLLCIFRGRRRRRLLTLTGRHDRTEKPEEACLSVTNQFSVLRFGNRARMGDDVWPHGARVSSFSYSSPAGGWPVRRKSALLGATRCGGWPSVWMCCKEVASCPPAAASPTRARQGSAWMRCARSEAIVVLFLLFCGGEVTRLLMGFDRCMYIEGSRYTEKRRRNPRRSGFGTRWPTRSRSACFAALDDARAGRESESLDRLVPAEGKG